MRGRYTRTGTPNSSSVPNSFKFIFRVAWASSKKHIHRSVYIYAHAETERSVWGDPVYVCKSPSLLHLSFTGHFYLNWTLLNVWHFSFPLLSTRFHNTDSQGSVLFIRLWSVVLLLYFILMYKLSKSLSVGTFKLVPVSFYPCCILWLLLLQAYFLPQGACFVPLCFSFRIGHFSKGMN